MGTLQFWNIGNVDNSETHNYQSESACVYTGAHGPPTCICMSEHYVCVGTEHGWILIYDTSSYELLERSNIQPGKSIQSLMLLSVKSAARTQGQITGQWILLIKNG